MAESLSLTQQEARARAALLEVHRYDLDFDLTGLVDGDELRTDSVITFSCSEPGAATFVECLGEIEEASLNGVSLPTGWPPDGRLALVGLQPDNVLSVRSVQRETGIGRGVHRAVDPADGAVYIWSSFEPDDARVAFACFDQPDLKAVFAISVTAPGDWTALSNSDVAEVTPAGDARRWRFADTPRLSTYVVVFNAGPFAQLHSSRAGYDLGLYARRSLADCLARDAEELFDLTERGLRFYGEQFDFAFPQTRYDQVFVPEMGGAMENYGCVTYSDTFVYRETPSYAERELRAVVLLHEMAHMWFGDLVTMVWWDDLWLNESFAEWACAWSATAATEFTDVWAGMLASDKLRAYAADQAPTTHPIRQVIPDTAVAAASFDAITYMKGAAVLKQLVAYVGEQHFVAALGGYFRRYAWQNTTLDDLVAEIEQQSGRDLTDWVQGWLGTSGTDRLTLQRGNSGLQLHAHGVGGRPALPHRLNVGVYDVTTAVDSPDPLPRLDSIEVRVAGEVTELGSVEASALVLVNDDDLTFASVHPDESTLALLLQHGARLPTPLSRTLVVAAARDLLVNSELAPADFLACVQGVLPRETADSVVEPLLQLAVDVADYWSPAGQREGLLTDLAEVAIELAEHSTRRLPALRALARSATTTAQLDELAERADTADLRWRRQTRLAELDQLDEGELQQLLRDDPNPEAWASAEAVRGAQPDAEAKRRAWELTFDQRKIPVDQMPRLGTAFWRRGQEELVQPYLDRYVEGLPGITGSGMQWALAVVGSMFPRAASDEAYAARLIEAVADPGVSPLVNQRIRERADTLQRTLRARQSNLPRVGTRTG
ncbi:MAG TPA: aminopeptidase N [Propionibacteriaceae bacterium]|nr:aminopeptidase N [Propionibacteriaceae bacterium]